MEVLIIGVGDAFSSHHFGSSALIKAPGGFVLLDCPDLVHRALREATGAAGWSVDAFGIEDIILTHLHGDHCNGLESFGFMRRMKRFDDPGLIVPRLHTTEPVSKRLWQRLGPAMDAPIGDDPDSTLDDFYDVHVMTPESPVTVAGLSVRCRFTRHPVPTVGLMISDGTRTLGWSGDTSFVAAHIDWLSEADLIVHETSDSAVHTPVEELNALPAEIRAKMRLIHAPDDFDRSRTDLVPLYEGEILTV